MPKISIITTSYNAQDTIERTIQNVQSQSYKDFEYILVDGNSKDKTLEIAGQYKDFIKKWISEPDKGKFDAMNKGVLLAQGEYILFLNANDVFVDENSLNTMVENIGDEDIIFFDYLVKKTGSEKVCKPNYNNKLTLFKGEGLLSCQLIKRELLESMGGFDLRFKILSGLEFDLRAIKQNYAKIKYVDKTVTVVEKFSEKELSPKRIKRFVKEKTVLNKNYFSKIEVFLFKLLEIFC